MMRPGILEEAAEIAFKSFTVSRQCKYFGSDLYFSVVPRYYVYLSVSVPDFAEKSIQLKRKRIDVSLMFNRTVTKH